MSVVQAAAAMIGSCTMPCGRMFFHALDALPGFGAFIYIPNAGIRDARATVLVHGITRNAAEHVLRFAALAEKHQTILVAPLFSRALFPRYQTLGFRNQRWAQPEAAMDTLLDDLQARYAIDLSAMYGFGFSGGAQFLHRYAMRKPARFRRMVIGAAGWYTFPDSDVPYPRGIGEGAHTSVAEQLPAYLRLPIQVIVGSRDNRCDAALNQSTDIRRQQGRTRIGRGQRYVKALHERAAALGLASGAVFLRLPGAGHDFSEAMLRHGLGEQVAEFLFCDGDAA